MNNREFIKIFDEVDSDFHGDNAFKGLLIIAKYFDVDKTDIICGGEHDEIYSVGVDEIIKAGITKEDTIALANLNWSIEDEDYLQCFI